jgi:beta-glucosidase
MNALKSIIITVFLFASCFTSMAQNGYFTAAGASVHETDAAKAFDRNIKIGWKLTSKDLKSDQYLQLALKTPGDVKEISLDAKGLSASQLQSMLTVFVTYDPMNPGAAVAYTLKGEEKFILSFPPKYGAHIKLLFKGGIVRKPVSISELSITYAQSSNQNKPVIGAADEQVWRNPNMPLEQRVETLLAAMTPEDKMELLREGWGIPGIPRLGIPFLNKVEAIHGFSYGSGATIFPQSIGLGATWNKKLVEEVAMVIGDETKSANTVQAWSPVLDVAQDARWGRCEETYGEDPVLVSEIGGAWIKGFQSKGLFATPKHFGGHGAPLGGRDSHDIGLSEREFREIHLVPFRHVIETYHCQSIMENYSDFLGVPVAKSKELLNGILREEWGFDGFIVSDCGALGNLTSRKHYTATSVIEAANQSLEAGIATNCGDTYNNKSVIEAAKNGTLNMEALDKVCRIMLGTIFRNGLFDHNPSKPLNWKTIYPGWNSPEHKEVARRSARESIVLLENKADILPLAKTIQTIAVIGPGADDLQPGDYTPKLQEGQLKSVLSGIKASVDKNTKVNYVKGCEFLSTEGATIDAAVKAALASEVAILVLGDCSTSESTRGIKKTSGESSDYASLILPGNQQKLLEAVCETGKPVILVLQVGRPYDLSFASAHCKAILVNWLPGQEGGLATADVLFGEYNPAGRLPMTFPRNVAQLPLYYNFKTSGRGYNYVDMSFYPLYSFGYGLSYAKFSYSDLKTTQNEDGTVTIQAKVTNIGKMEGDEVVQLYVTDMYASVKTRVMELKDFNRISLASGETKTVEFKLAPYQLSLLNDQMDRVVEPGEFKIMVGGHSPSFAAADKIKDSVGFKTPQDGVTGMLDYKKSFKADFVISFDHFGGKQANNKTSVFVKVKNTGNLTDIGKVTLFANGTQNEEVHHFELAPNQEKTVQFEVNQPDVKNVTVTSKYKCISYNF